MSWISKLLGTGAKDVLNGVDDIIGRFKASPTEKQQFKLELERLLQMRDSEIEQTIRSELSAKEKVLVAELTQSDNYTKRARPTVVYAGLVFIFLNYILVPTIQSFIPDVAVKPFDLPTEFWVAWGGIVSTWVIGRSAEKRGVRNKAVGLITGTEMPTSSLFDEPKG